MRNFVLLLLAVCSAFTALTQNLQSKNLPSDSVIVIPYNAKGDKYVEFKIRDIVYSDSTERECSISFNAMIKSVGQKTKVGEFYNQFLGTQDYFFGYVIDGTKRFGRLCSPTVINKNDSVKIYCQLKLYHGDNNSIYYLNHKLLSIPAYDGRIKEEQNRLEKLRLQQEAKRKRDSIEVYYMPIEDRLISDYAFELPKGYTLPDTLRISEGKYGIKGKKLMRVIHFYGRCDTIYQNGFTESEISSYESAIANNYMKSKPIEKINDREVFRYFSIGDSIQDFLSRLGSKKVIDCGGARYQLSFPHELTKEPEVFEFRFYEGRLSQIERITPIKHSLPTNDIKTAFQLLKMKDDIEKAAKSRKQTQKKSH